MRRVVAAALSTVFGACSVTVVTGTTVVAIDQPFRVGDLECAVDEALTEFVDYAEGVVGETTAQAAIEAYRRQHPGRFRDLRLDPDRSTDTRWVYVDGRGWARLIVDVRELAGRTWVVGGSEECSE